MVFKVRETIITLYIVPRYWYGAGRWNPLLWKARTRILQCTVYPKKYAHGFCFAVLCCGYTLTDFPISIRLTSLALWQSNDCPSASKATLMNMDKYFMWIHYERLHNHNKAKHNKTVCIFLGIYCSCHGRGWNSNTWSHDIRSDDIDLVFIEYSNPNRKQVKLLFNDTESQWRFSEMSPVD